VNVAAPWLDATAAVQPYGASVPSGPLAHGAADIDAMLV